MDNNFYIQIDDNEEVIEITTRVFEIGRIVNKTKNKIIIDDPAISGTHCLIAIKDTKIPHFWVWDGNGKIGSKNKTILNGVRLLDGSSPVEIQKGCRIYHGDFILIGNHKVKFLISRKTLSDKDKDATL
jgi:pSer/pThr/pTyr-binding forkhead associated (FHA) protein